MSATYPAIRDLRFNRNSLMKRLERGKVDPFDMILREDFLNSDFDKVSRVSGDDIEVHHTGEVWHYTWFYDGYTGLASVKRPALLSKKGTTFNVATWKFNGYLYLWLAQQPLRTHPGWSHLTEDDLATIGWTSLIDEMQKLFADNPLVK